MDYAYQRLDIWKKAVDLSIKVIECIAEVADEMENQRLTGEIEMSAVNIATNIAKGKACLSEEDFIYLTSPREKPVCQRKISSTICFYPRDRFTKP